jgi:hypothetical protein
MRLSPLAFAIVLGLSACSKTAVTREEAAPTDDGSANAIATVSLPADTEVSADAAAEPGSSLDKVSVVGGAANAQAAGRRDALAAKSRMRQEQKAAEAHAYMAAPAPMVAMSPPPPPPLGEPLRRARGGVRRGRGPGH